MEPPTDLYLNLLKGCLTRSLFLEEENYREVHPGGWRALVWEAYKRVKKRPDYHIVAPAAVDSRARAEGRDWPHSAETMIGHRRLDNVQYCVTNVLADNVPGDLIEAGVWRGGAAILMRAVLAAHGVSNRSVWVADSFEGLPTPNLEQYPNESTFPFTDYQELAVSVEQVKANFARYGLLDDKVRFLVGWFTDTLSVAPIDKLAVARLDGDLYESTIDAITALYPKLSVGGYLIVDDYVNIRACQQAIDDYRAAHSISEPIQQIDWNGVYWRRAA